MIIAADILTGADPVVAQALRHLDPAPLQDLARRCEAAGAQILDLNPGYLSRRLENRMAFLVEAVQEVTILPLILDSPNPRVLAGGLGVSSFRKASRLQAIFCGLRPWRVCRRPVAGAARTLVVAARSVRWQTASA